VAFIRTLFEPLVSGLQAWLMAHVVFSLCLILLIVSYPLLHTPV
jgi:hypothetical protein